MSSRTQSPVYDTIRVHDPMCPIMGIRKRRNKGRVSVIREGLGSGYTERLKQKALVEASVKVIMLNPMLTICTNPEREDRLELFN